MTQKSHSKKPSATGKGNDTLQLATTINYNVVTMATKTLCSLEHHFKKYINILNTFKVKLKLFLYYIVHELGREQAIPFCRLPQVHVGLLLPLTIWIILQNSCMQPMFYTNSK